jgi:hypothetical protein
MIERWVVVGGCPRSGTTLVGNALGAAEARHRHARRRSSPAKRWPPSPPGSVAADPRDIIAFIAAHWRFRIWAEPMPDTHGPIFRACARRAARSVPPSSAGSCRNTRNRQGQARRARLDRPHTPEHLRAVPDLLTSDFRRCTASTSFSDGRGVAASMKRVDWGPRDVVPLADWWLARVAEAFAATQVAGGAGST